MIPGCGHEEAINACPSCEFWWGEQRGECEGSAFCNEDNYWRRCELTRVEDDGYQRDLCPECLTKRRNTIDEEGRGDYLRDCAKDDAS